MPEVTGERTLPESARAPEPVSLPLAAREPVLALGAFLQNAVALADGGVALRSRPVGDLEDERARALQRAAVRELEERLGRPARTFAVDLHPDYPGTWLGEELARARGGRVLRVQHHLAHAAATLGEHGRWPASAGERAGAIVLDGTGFGPDGTAWGAEWLEIAGDLSWRRAAHADELPLVGGERAVREPWRVAAAALALAGLDARLGDLPLAAHVPAEKLAQVAMLSRRDRAAWPRACGAGRLFEAAGAMLGLAAVNAVEGDAAIRLEALAHEAADVAPWPEVRVAPGVPGALGTPGAQRLPSVELLAALARRALAGERHADVAAGFHATFCALAADLARRAFAPDVRVIALGGGCLVNRLLDRGLAGELGRAGFEVLAPRVVPAGDAGLAYGQCVVASAALALDREPELLQEEP